MSQRLVGQALPGDRVDPSRALSGLLLLVALVVLAVASGNGAYLVGAAGFLVALLVSVVLHEAGHFVMARRYGMKATEFFVGFGPTLFSRRRGETEYGVKAVPAGGYVKIIGMTPLEEVEPGDEPRAFYRAPVRQKVAVLAAGSTIHVLLAAALVVLGTFLIGVPAERAPAVGALTSCIAPDRVGVTDIAPDTDPCTLPGNVPAPARGAGLQVGDVVTAVSGTRVDSGSALSTALRAAGDQTVQLSVQRDGQRLVLPVTPATLQRFPVVGGQLDADRLAPTGTIGIAIQQRIDTERVGPVESLRESGDQAVAMLEGLRTTVTEKLGSITKIYSDERDPAGFVGIVGVGRISGEVVQSDETVGVKLLTFVSIVAGLNLFVGVFNALPLLPLDGGHIAVAVFEGARDRVRRLRGYRGEVQRVDYQKLLPLTYAVALLFLLFTVALVGADLFNPIRISS